MTKKFVPKVLSNGRDTPEMLASLDSLAKQAFNRAEKYALEGNADRCRYWRHFSAAVVCIHKMPCPIVHDPDHFLISITGNSPGKIGYRCGLEAYEKITGITPDALKQYREQHDS